MKAIAPNKRRTGFITSRGEIKKKGRGEMEGRWSVLFCWRLLLTCGKKGQEGKGRVKSEERSK
jgi:hypothetical protein